MRIDTGVVAYSANTMQGDAPMPVPGDQGGYIHYAQKVDGQVIRDRSQSFINHFGQATLFWNSMSDAEKGHIVAAFQFEVGKVKDKGVRQKVVEMFSHVDGNLAAQIAAGIGVTSPPDMQHVNDGTAMSPALSQENTAKSACTRMVAVLLEDGFCYDSAAGVMDALKAAGVKAEIVCSRQGMVTAEDGRQLEAPQDYRTAAPVLYDAVYVPGGKKQKTTQEAMIVVKQFLTEMFLHCKPIGAAGEGVELLGMIKPVNAVAQPDGFGGVLANQYGVVTANPVGDINAFSAEFVNAIGAHRHWGRYVKI